MLVVWNGCELPSGDRGCELPPANLLAFSMLVVAYPDSVVLLFCGDTAGFSSVLTVRTKWAPRNLWAAHSEKHFYISSAHSSCIAVRRCTPTEGIAKRRNVQEKGKTAYVSNTASHICKSGAVRSTDGTGSGFLTRDPTRPGGF